MSVPAARKDRRPLPSSGKHAPCAPGCLQYARFALPRHWGRGRAAVADGTHVTLRENNLLGSRHVRYGGYGGIAHHHIADTYVEPRGSPDIALFLRPRVEGDTFQADAVRDRGGR